MWHKELKNSNFIINENTSIKEAMASMNDNKRGTVVVVNKDFHLVGILSDGDIRRSLVKGKNILCEVKEILNLNPIFIKEGDEEEQSKKIFTEKPAINVLPVVDKNNQLINVLIRN